MVLWWWCFLPDVLSFSFQFSIFPLSHLFSTLLYLIVLQLISCTDKKIHSCVTVCLPGQQTLISALSTYEHLPSMNLIQQALTNLPLSVLHTQIKKTKQLQANQFFFINCHHLGDTGAANWKPKMKMGHAQFIWDNSDVNGIIVCQLMGVYFCRRLTTVYRAHFTLETPSCGIH